MERGGAFEIEGFAGGFALAFDAAGKRGARRLERLDDASDFPVVLFLGAAGETWREAHLHFGIDAAGKCGVAADLDLAAANFEEIEELIRERIGLLARGERAEIISTVVQDAARDVTPRIGISQIDFQKRCGPQSQECAIIPGKMLARVLIKRERLFEARARGSKAKFYGDFAQVQSLRGSVGEPQEAFRRAAKIHRSRQKRFRSRTSRSGARFNQINAGLLRNRSEELLICFRIEIQL